MYPVDISGTYKNNLSLFYLSLQYEVYVHLTKNIAKQFLSNCIR